MERYESLGVVGEGSYGVVLKCRHRETGQVVAVKKFLESDEDQNVKKIAMREVRMLKKLRHENLINLIEFFRRKRRLYLVFEYVDHTVLDELEACDSGGLEAEVARSHIFQVIRGVAFCHLNQIIHRDVKPENVLVSRLGVVKLCDFGFARTLEGPNETCTDYVATRWYRAPELLVGDTKYGREVDIWAIGCLLAEILSGEPLFPGESDIDQLFHIIQTLGELSSSHKHLIHKNPMLSGLHLPAGASTPLSVTFPKWPPRTMAFISECLDLSPSKRPSSEGLLKHEYFTYDSFPNIFLPELQKKVQQEFISNSLLQQPNCRKGSAQGGEKKARKPKNCSPQQSQSFKYVPKTQSTSRASPKKLSNQAPVFSTASLGQPELSNTYSTPVLQSHLQIASQQSSNLQAQSLPLSQMLQPSYVQAQLPSSHQSHIPIPSLTHNAGTTRSFVTYPPNPISKLNTFLFDEGPSSLPYSQIPPIKETQAINTETLNNFTIFQNEPQLPSSTFSLHANRNANSQAMLNLQLMLSPSRSFRKDEKSKKSPQGLWSTGTKGLSIQGQNQFLNFSTAEPPVQKESRTQFPNDPPITTTTTTTSLAPISPFSRHHQFDSGRHPYAISLDRSKEVSARDINRDPLREIKDNSREGRKDNMPSSNNNNNNGNTHAKDASRRTRKEGANWAKPRLLNDDLYLPDVPGVSGKQISSPSKTSRTEALTAGDGGFSRNVGQAKEKKSSVGLMPHIGGQGSASSTDSFESLCPGSKLPYV